MEISDKYFIRILIEKLKAAKDKLDEADNDLYDIKEINIIYNELKEYKEAKDELMKDLHGLTYEEMKERCSAMYGLIPFHYSVSEYQLGNMIKEQFGDHPDWKTDHPTYTIPVGNIKDDNVEDYVKEIAEKMKKGFK